MATVHDYCLPEQLTPHALVVLSGGLDSSTCLVLATRLFEKVSAICFDYGQRNVVEIKQAEKLCEMFNVPFKLVDMSTVFEAVSTSALIADGPLGNVNAPHPLNNNLPSSYVPNRNTMFLTVAHAWAQTIGASCVVTGISEVDGAHYPDTTLDFAQQLQVVLTEGSGTDIGVFCPLATVDKAGTFQLARSMNVLDVIIEHSHSCYNGVRSTLHPWGYGCGDCISCTSRAEGFEKYEKGLTNE